MKLTHGIKNPGNDTDLMDLYIIRILEHICARQGFWQQIRRWTNPNPIREMFVTDTCLM